MSSDELRERIKAAAQRFDTTSFELAFDLAVVAKDRLYRGWNHPNFAEYLKKEVAISVAWGYKLAGVGRCFWKHRAILCQRKDDSPSLQAMIDAVPAIERGEVSADQIMAGESVVSAPHLRTVRAIPATLKPIMDRAFALARWHLCTPQPSETELWEAVLASYIENAEQEIWQSGSLHHTTSDGIQLDWTIEDVVDGKIRCQQCGSWDRSSLDPHHTTPRSQQSHQTDPAGIQLLCRSCHQQVQGWQVLSA